MSTATIGDAIKSATAFLASAGIPDAAVDARHLVAHALGVDRAALLRAPEQPLDAEAQRRLTASLQRRAAREPVSRIIGQREFHGLTLALGNATLDPRPDTETVVTVALDLAARIAPRIAESGDGPLRILDLGTGTGAIVLALLAELPNAEATATDISAAALDIAQHNAEHHGLAGRVRFLLSHWLDDVAGRYHVIVANPPYIQSGDVAALAPEVTEWDPPAALDGGHDGLDAYRAILADVQRVLDPGGWVVFEVGHGQASQVAELAAASGLERAPMDWPLLKDLGGRQRCVAVTRTA